MTTEENSKTLPHRIIKKSQYDTYLYVVKLVTGETYVISEIIDVFIDGDQTWYEMKLAGGFPLELNGIQLRQKFSVNASHVVAIFDAES